MMLLRLLPEQISVQWDEIKRAITEVLPRSTGKVDMNEILMDLLNGSMQCWLSCRRSKEGNTVEGLIVTQVIKDRFEGGKSLLIYSLCGYQMDNREAWEESFRSLSAFAKGEGCQRITAFTNVSSLIKLAERLGGDVSQRFVSILI